jgi:hypothetical protein
MTSAGASTANRRRRLARAVASFIAAAAVGMVLASTAAAVTYDCYWATSGCGFGAIAAGAGWQTPGYLSSSERPFENNQTTATSNKRIQRFNSSGSWDGGAWNGGPQVWVVQIFNQVNKGWGCYSRADVPGGTISVNCGYYH